MHRLLPIPAILICLTVAAFADEPDLSGVWQLKSITAYENGKKSLDGAPQMFGEDLNARFSLTRKNGAYQIEPMRVDGKAPDFTLGLTVEKQGDRYIGTLTGKKNMSIAVLLEIQTAAIRIIGSPTAPDTTPDTFGPSNDPRHVRIEASFNRPDAEAVVTVKGPLGAKVSVGGGQREIGDEPITITTEKLPTDNVQSLDVSISHMVNGRLINDRMRLWLQGGTTTIADFTDIAEPDVAARTFRYWSSCRFTLYKRLDEAGRAKNNQERTKSLEKMATELRHTPSRGVDKEAIEKWLAVVSATETAVANRKNGDADFYLESILRGAAGDPFGASLDLQKEVEAEMEAFRKALIDVKNLTPLLTQRYDTEFPIP